MSTTRKLAAIRDELATAERRIRKVHDDYDIECENAWIDDEPEPELSECELKALRAATLELKNVVKELEGIVDAK